MKRKSPAALLVVVTLVVATSSAVAAAIVVGPGPQSPYTVQHQPAPSTCHYRWTAAKQPLPDVHCTPGATNPKVTPATIATTICRSGYTTSIRPPVTITNAEKKLNALSYNYRLPLSWGEYDHLIPLELGGDPNDPRNLWVEPPSPGHVASAGVYNPKDSIENYAKSLVCAHRVSLRVAQALIVANWTTFSAHFAGSPPTSTPTRVPTAGTPHDFANCAALNLVFAHGVGLPGAHDHTSGTPVTNFYASSPWYWANQSHDGDRDGIACEHH
jgi:hypothetical protein